MQSIKFLVLAGISAVVLSACAQPEPEPISIEPIYNKYGAASCAAGDYLSEDQNGRQTCVRNCTSGSSTVGANGQRYCLPPGGGCQPGTVAAGVNNNGQTICRPQRESDDPQTPGRTPNPNGQPTAGVPAQ